MMAEQKNYPLIFEAQDGCNHYHVASDVPKCKLEEVLPQELLRKQAPELPNLSEPSLVRHYTGLSERNRGVDNVFYPLGSCTMKYNPKINEDLASLPGFCNIHPLAPWQTTQGCLEAMALLEDCLKKITGMDAITLQPAAGAHGELTGMMVLKAFHEKNGQTQRNKIIVPDSAHGTNPASAHMAGFEIVEIQSAPDGRVELQALREAVGEDTAGLMLTNPSTLGLFERDILEITRIVHEAGGLVYYDGANLNAIMGICRPGDMGFDIVHLNLHKTFSTPHGGGGPGSGPVGVKQELARFLPAPVIEKDGNGQYYLSADRPDSIGKMKAFYGNFGVALKALCYILSIGAEGIKQAAQLAVLNANYIMHALKEDYVIPQEGNCMHEFVLSVVDKDGVHATDIAKALIDLGYHPPTMYFPLIVKEALMIEPTETESKQTLDEFIAAMKQIARTAGQAPDELHQCPQTTPVGRLDEVSAARHPKLRYALEEQE